MPYNGKSNKQNLKKYMFSERMDEKAVAEKRHNIGAKKESSCRREQPKLRKKSDTQQPK